MTLFLQYYTDLNRVVIRASQLVTTNRLPIVLQSSTKYINATFITILTSLQEKQAVAAGLLRRMQKLPLYVTYCGTFFARRYT